MWILKHKSDDKYFYLTGEKELYIVGRGNTDIQLKDDSSISRDHANIIIKQSNKNVIIIDRNSKYGTYINEGIDTKTPIKPGCEIVLKHMDSIRFGILQNSWIVIEKKYKTATSTLSPSNKDRVVDIMKSLSCSYDPNWSVTCTHLTMDKVTLTIKFVQALIAGVPVVTHKFWEELLMCVKSNKPVPKEELFMPVEAEPLMKYENNLLSKKIERRTVFANKTFIFLSNKQFEQFCPIIQEAQGKAILLAKSKLTKSKLCQKDMIVVQYIKNTYSQTSQTGHIVDEIQNYISKKNHRLIPESEIGLAILHCDTEKYCNPIYDFKINLLRPSTSAAIDNHNNEVLAPETEEFSEQKISKYGDENECSNEICQTLEENILKQNSKHDDGLTNVVELSALTAGAVPSEKRSISRIPEKNAVISAVNNSILTFNKPNKRKVNQTENSNEEIFTEAPKRRYVEKEDAELFCFESEPDTIQILNIKPNQHGNNTKKWSIMKIQNFIEPRMSNNEKQLKTVSNSDVTALSSHNPENWLSCLQNTIRLDVTEDKIKTETFDMTKEYSDWISEIREGIHVEQKNMCRKSNVFTDDSSVITGENFKRFRKVRFISSVL